MTADDAHSVVKNALAGVNDLHTVPGLHDLRLADLNDTEREHALDALNALHNLDAALAERSEFETVEDPRRTRRGNE